MSAIDPTTNAEIGSADVVGNAICDALMESPDPALIRVINWYGDWAEAAPNAQDFARTLRRCEEVVAKWPIEGPDSVAVLVRSKRTAGAYGRVRVDGETAITNVATVSTTSITDCYDTYGTPRLIPLDDVRSAFRDGDLA